MLILQALYVGSTLKFSLEQRHDVISTTFQHCSNVRCPLGLRYIDTVFLGRQNHDNQINAKFEKKNLVHYIEFGCLLLIE